MCVLLPSGETRNYINIRKERSRLWDRSPVLHALHNWWRIRSIRISSRNNGRIKKTTRLVLYKTLHYFAHDYLHFYCTKTLFSMQVKYYKFLLQKFKNTKHYFQLEEITLQRKYEIQDTKHYFQPKEIAANFSYKIQNHRHYLNVSRNIIT